MDWPLVAVWALHLRRNVDILEKALRMEAISNYRRRLCYVRGEAKGNESIDRLQPNMI